MNNKKPVDYYDRIADALEVISGDSSHIQDESPTMDYYDRIADALETIAQNPVTAYDMAIEGGYTGTKQQFEEDMGNSATNATNAAIAAESAINAATNFTNIYNYSKIYDTYNETIYRGYTDSELGSQITFSGTTGTWQYYKIDCTNFKNVAFSTRTIINTAHHICVFTDENDIIIKYENVEHDDNYGNPSSSNNKRIYVETTTPNNAKYLYVFTYSQINMLILSYNSIENVAIANNTIIESLKGKYDKDFIYIGYSEISQNGHSINTKEHYEWCAQNGYDAIKGDMQLTSDNKIIMCHDDTIGIDNNGDAVKPNSEQAIAIWTIHDKTYNECTALIRAGTNQHICGLDDLLFICKKYHKIPFITIRGGDYINDTLDEMFELLDKYSMRDSAIINSLSIESLIACRGKDQNITLSNVSSAVFTTTDVDDSALLGNCILCSFDFRTDGSHINEITPQMVTYAKSKNVRLFSAICNDVDAIDTLINLGYGGAQISRKIPYKLTELNNILTELNNILTAPNEDGNYTLKVTVNSGEATYSWVADN